MDPRDEEFSFHNDKESSSSFNGIIPSLRINIDISYDQESPSQNTEALIESEASRMEEKTFRDEDMNKTSRQIFESSPQNTEQKVSTESLSINSRQIKTAVFDEVFKNAKSLSNNSECLKEVSGVFEPTFLKQKEKQKSYEDFSIDAQKSNDKSQLPASLSQGIESFKRIISESETSHLDEKQTPHDEFGSSVKQMNGIIQLPESLYQNAECFQGIPINTEPTLLEEAEVQIQYEDLCIDTREINDIWQISDSLTQNNTFLQEIRTETELILEETEKEISHDDFRGDIKHINGMCHHEIPKSRSPNTNIQEIIAESSLLGEMQTQNYHEDVGKVVRKVKRQIGVSETLESSSQRTNYLQEIPMESNPLVGEKRKWQASERDENYGMKKRKCQMAVSSSPQKIECLQDISCEFELNKRKSQMSELSPQKTECLQDIPFESTPKKRHSTAIEISPQKTEYLRNIPAESEHKKMKYKAFELSLQKTECMQGIPVESEPKNLTCQITETPSQATECLQDVTAKPVTSRKKKRQTSDRNFKNTVKKIKGHYKPKMQLSSQTIEVMDNLINHFLDMFNGELHRLNRVKKFKTLTAKQLDNVIKLSLPKKRACKAIEYGQMAVERLLKSAG